MGLGIDHKPAEQWCTGHLAYQEYVMTVSLPTLSLWLAFGDCMSVCAGTDPPPASLTCVATEEE